MKSKYNNPLFVIDSYNQGIPEFTSRPGTLVGNWVEEAVQREVAGAARSYPRHHVPRSALKSEASTSEHRSDRIDNTFQRVNGARDHPVENCLLTTNHALRPVPSDTIQTVGPREKYYQLVDRVEHLSGPTGAGSDGRASSFGPGASSESRDMYCWHVTDDVPSTIHRIQRPARSCNSSTTSEVESPDAHGTLGLGIRQWAGRNTSFSHTVEVPRIAKALGLGTGSDSRPPPASLPALRGAVKLALEAQYGGYQPYDSLATALGGGSHNVSITDFIEACGSLDDHSRTGLRVLLESPWVRRAGATISVKTGIDEISCMS